MTNWLLQSNGGVMTANEFAFGLPASGANDGVIVAGASGYWHSNVMSGGAKWLEGALASPKSITNITVRFINTGQNFTVSYYNGSTWQTVETRVNNPDLVVSLPVSLANVQKVKLDITADPYGYARVVELEANESNDLTAVFSFPATSINVGENAVATVADTGGDGSTKVRTWKVDTISVTPAVNGNQYTFSGLSAGLHTIEETVTDNSGTSSTTRTIYVGSITGAASVVNGATSAYTTNVSNPVWSIASGPGAVNSSTGVYTGAGSAPTVIKATKTGDATQFATKQITNVPPAPVAGFTVPATVYLGQSVTPVSTATGSITSTVYDKEDDGVTDAVPFNYGSLGVKTVRQTVTGPGGSHTTTQTITVIEAPPAQLTSSFSPDNGPAAPATIMFTDSTDGVVTQQRIIFGDGSEMVLATDVPFSHQYLAPGIYEFERHALVGGRPSSEYYSITIGGAATVAVGTNLEFDEIEIPRHYSEGAKGGPEHLTTKFDSPAGMQQRNITRYDPIHKFDLVFEGERADSLFSDLVAFRMTRWGEAIGFRFFPPYDNRWDNHQIGLTQPGTATYKFYKNYTVAGRTYQRRIVKPVPGCVLFINGTPATTYSAYTIDYTTGKVTFASPNALPVNGKLTITGEYCIPVVFEGDMFSATNYTTYLDTDSVKVVEILPAALGID